MRSSWGVVISVGKTAFLSTGSVRSGRVVNETKSKLDVDSGRLYWVYLSDIGMWLHLVADRAESVQGSSQVPKEVNSRRQAGKALLIIREM